MIRRPPRSTPLYSSAASDVYKRQDYKLSIQGYWNIREVDRACPADLLTQGLKARSGNRFSDPAYMAAAVEYLKSHPGRVIAGFFDKAWRHLSNYEIPRNTNFATLRADVLVWR